MRSSSALLAATAAITSLSSVGSAATFYQRAQVDLAPATTAGGVSEIGSNASGVAWDGTNAVLAGYNASSTTTRDTALVTVSNVLTAPTFGSRYGVQASTAANRGYAAADFKPGVGTGTAYYGGGTNVLISLYAPGSTTASFASSIATGGNNPVSGVNFDTRANRISYMYQNSGLLRNLYVNAADGTVGTSSGNVNTNVGPVYGTLFRDFDFDASGNYYGRVNNNVVLASRNGDGSFSTTPTLLADLTDGNQVGQNIGVLEGFAGSSAPLFAIYNDRASTAAQTFASSVKGVLPNGTAESLSFLSGDGTAASPLAGTSSFGFYDFSYDAASQTLAVLDYGNSQLYIFGATAAVPEPTTLGLLAGAAIVALRRRRA